MEPRKRKRLLLAFAAGLFVFALWFFLLRNPEPFYEGKRLSEWVVMIAVQMNPFPDNPPPYTTSELEAATRAIRAIGTNGLPHLVQWLAYEPSGLRKSVSRNFLKVPYRFVTNLAIYTVVYEPYLKATGARDAFAILGSTAAPAVPALSQIVHSTNYSTRTRQHALSALACIGPDAFPSMLGVVSNLSQPSDLWSTHALMELNRHDLDQLLSALLPHLQSTNLPVALRVSKFLSYMTSASELIEPAYIRCLEDPRWEIRAEAASALRPWGWGRAQAAVPALVKALGDTNATVRANAAAAIRMIDPGALPEELRTPASPP